MYMYILMFVCTCVDTNPLEYIHFTAYFMGSKCTRYYRDSQVLFVYEF